MICFSNQNLNAKNRILEEMKYELEIASLEKDEELYKQLLGVCPPQGSSGMEWLV